MEDRTFLGFCCVFCHYFFSFISQEKKRLNIIYSQIKKSTKKMKGHIMALYLLFKAKGCKYKFIFTQKGNNANTDHRTTFTIINPSNKAKLLRPNRDMYAA